jgi:hypothetical protein
MAGRRKNYEKLLAEAQKIGGYASKRATLLAAIETLLAEHQRAGFFKLAGTLDASEFWEKQPPIRPRKPKRARQPDAA